METTIIITAGGIGKRMGGDLPKQFILVGNKPLLFHTIDRFYEFDSSAQILLTLPIEWIPFWEKLCEKYQYTIPHTIIKGGIERYHSVKNALDYAEGDYIAIHDAVRPFVSTETIKKCISSALLYGSAVPVTFSNDSMRMVNKDGSSSVVDRASFRLIQTPQVYEKRILQTAYQLEFHAGITDDASLVEEAGFTIHLVEGNCENIKITTPSDLLYANFLMK